MFALIVAMDEKNLIGKGNSLPWHYKEDMKYFKQTTMNHSVVMGYHTYLSIIERNKKALPNRLNLVVTSHKDVVEKVEVISSLPLFIEENKETDELIFIIGGAKLYEAMLPYAKYLYITRIHKEYEGDVYFPRIPEEEFHLIKETKGTESKELSFMIYERTKYVL